MTNEEFLAEKFQRKTRDLEFLRQALDEHAIVSIADRSGRIIYANHKFTEVSQYSLAELIGQDHRLLNSGHHGRRFWVDCWRAIANGKIWHGEVKNRKKDGTHYWVETTIVPFRNSDGQIEQYVSVRTEITKIKQYEEQLTQNKLELEERVRARTAELEVVNRELAREKELLHTLAAATAGDTGKEFYRSLVVTLAKALRIRMAFIAELTEDDHSKARTLAVAGPEGPLPNFAYGFAGTPCEHVLKQEAICVGRGIQQMFPQDKELAHLDAQAYVGVPIFDDDNRVIGHVAMVDDQPLDNQDYALSVVRIFAARAGAEHRRRAAQERIRRHYEIQRVVNELLYASMQPFSLQQTLERALDEILSLPWTSFIAEGSVFLVSSDRTSLVLSAQQGISPSLQKTCARVTMGECLCGDAAKRGEIIEASADCETRFSYTQQYGHLVVPIKADNRVLGVVKLYRSRNLRNQEDERQLINTISMTMAAIIERKKADEALEQAYRHKSEFLANMSHELRTPLNAIIGFSKTLLQEIEGPTTPLQQESLAHIRESGEHLLALINDVLDLSKIQAGKMELSMGNVDLKRLINESIAAVKPLVDEKGLRLTTRTGSTAMKLRADAVRLKQVLLNLLSNAVKFADRGEIAVEADICEDPQYAPPHVAAGAAFLLLSVKDQGIGIASEHLAAIFDEFRQVDGKINRKRGGTGLGLPISKRFVEMHGGAIRVRSEEGKGTTVFVSLPLGGDAQPRGSASRPTTAPVRTKV